MKRQILHAGGGAPELAQEQIAFRGHSIECRVNAEDPNKGFLPKPGTIHAFTMPSGPGVRVDTHVYPGYILPSNYDSLLAKVITTGRDREEALARMRRALREMNIEGVPTTVEFHKRVLEDSAFLSGQFHTRYIREQMFAGHAMQNML